MNRIFIYACVLIIASQYGCSSSSQYARPQQSNSPQKYYTSAFPGQNVSPQLQQIQRSVMRYTTTGFYETYFFDNSNITLENIKKTNFSSIASRKATIDESKAGTAVTLLQNNNHTIMLTAQHVLAFPDTVVAYKKGRNASNRRYVESIAVKRRQRNYLYSNDQIFSIDVIGENRVKDIALIKIATPDRNSPGQPLSLPFGKASDLRTGSFIYVLGYPLGSPMVTRGIVSAPNFDGSGAFLTDALFNHGISGGIIIASRTNFSSFEWVGMAVTASASEKQFLIPDPIKRDTYYNYETYTDTAYVSKERLINYGVTQATPTEQIVLFLLQHENELNDLGFSVTDITENN